MSASQLSNVLVIYAQGQGPMTEMALDTINRLLNLLLDEVNAFRKTRFRVFMEAPGFRPATREVYGLFTALRERSG